MIWTHERRLYISKLYLYLSFSRNIFLCYKKPPLHLSRTNTVLTIGLVLPPSERLKMHHCLVCGLVVPSVAVLRLHSFMFFHLNPFLCDVCDLSFPDNPSLHEHFNSSSNHPIYQSLQSRVQHDAKEIDSDSECPDLEKIQCLRCRLWFNDANGLRVHYIVSPLHHWCFICKRYFKLAGSLDAHLDSIAHADRVLECPFCTYMFKTPSGMAMHLENGDCKNKKIDRHQVTAAVRSMNLTPNICIAGASIQAPTSTPMASSLLIATQASFNGRHYDCPIPNCTKHFRKLDALNRHLNSPAHDASQFKCPGCSKEFKVISGFVQHVESRTCTSSVSRQLEDHIDHLAGKLSRRLRLT